MGIDIRGIKQQLRASSKEYRRSLRLSEKARKDEAIFKQVAALPEYQKAKLLLTYISTPIEVATFRLLEDALRKGKAVAAPRCVPGKIAMDFYRITSMRDLESASFSVLEPKTECCPRLTRFPEAVCILPGLAFDRAGFRLGYGKGYYDRFLSRYHGVTIGICYDACVHDELPRGRFDRRADILVTESGVLRLKKEKLPVKGAFVRYRPPDGI